MNCYVFLGDANLLNWQGYATQENFLLYNTDISLPIPFLNNKNKNICACKSIYKTPYFIINKITHTSYCICKKCFMLLPLINRSNRCIDCLEPCRGNYERCLDCRISHINYDNFKIEFGKYKGEYFHERCINDASYCQWILNTHFTYLPAIKLKKVIAAKLNISLEELTKEYIKTKEILSKREICESNINFFKDDIKLLSFYTLEEKCLNICLFILSDNYTIEGIDINTNLRSEFTNNFFALIEESTSIAENQNEGDYLTKIKDIQNLYKTFKEYIGESGNLNRIILKRKINY